ncbi:hypothetical protein DFP73DRAFT_596111 [Morchella snyderi]|nr:hypothetical protein DFP73DRAFT_596111 [Morchella snyderi]
MVEHWRGKFFSDTATAQIHAAISMHDGDDENGGRQRGRRTSVPAKPSTKKFLKTKDAYNIGPEIWESIGKDMLASATNFPSLFGNPFRNFAEHCHHLNSAEWKTFKMLLAPIYFKDHLPDEDYEEFINVVETVQLCCENQLTFTEIAGSRIAISQPTEQIRSSQKSAVNASQLNSIETDTDLESEDLIERPTAKNVYRRRGVTPVEKELEDTTDEALKKNKKCGYKNRQDMAIRMQVDPQDATAIRERRHFLKVLCARCGQPLEKCFDLFDAAVLHRLFRVVSAEMKQQFGEVRNANAKIRAVKKKGNLNQDKQRSSQKANTKRKNVPVVIGSSDVEEQEKEEEPSTPKAKAPGTVFKSAPLAPPHFVDTSVSVSATHRNDFIVAATPKQLALPSTPDVSSSGAGNHESSLGAENNIFNHHLIIYVAGHLPFKIKLTTDFEGFETAISRVLPLEEYSPTEYTRMIEVCGEGGVLVKIADSSWWNEEALDENELAVNPQLWHDKVEAAQNRKIKPLSGTLDIAKGQKKPAPHKGAKASTQVSNPSSPESQAIGCSSTQPIPGSSFTRPKRKADSTKTVPDLGVELQLPGSQFPESQFPESQFPKSQFPESQFSESQFSESQSPELQFFASIQVPDSQFVPGKRPRGRPKGSGKQKELPPSIPEESTVMENPRRKRATKQPKKAIETAAIQAEKYQTEQTVI